MHGTMQPLSQRRGTHPRLNGWLPEARLAGAIAVAIALASLPGTASARDTTQDTAAGAAAQQAKPAAKAPKSKTGDKAAAGQDEAAKADHAKELAGVVVTGIRASLESAQSLKQNASQIIDSVTATDINALPDRSVTETLQRISGVTVDHFLADDDPDHPAAEGSGVLIRGLPHVASLLNGRESISANNGRSLGFQDVPSELMAGVDVYKNPSAELIEGGIGGTVNLRTRMPFDNPGQVTAFSYGINEGDLAKKSKPSASFLWSNRWKTDSLGEFGALVDVSYSELDTRSDGIQTNPYLLEPADNLGACPCEPTSTNGNVAIPGDINWSQQDMRRRRIGLYGALQWRPTSDLEFSSQFFRSNYNLQWNQHWVQTNESNYYDMVPMPGTTFDYDGNGVFQRGTLVSNAWKGSPSAAPTVVTGWPPLGNTEYYADNRLNTQFTRTTDFSNGFKYNINDHVLLTGDVQLVKSTSNTLDFSVYNQFFMAPAVVDLSGTPSLTLTNPDYAYLPPSASGNPSSLTNPANYYLGAAMDHLEYDYAMERAGRLDLEYNFEDGSWLQYFRVGVRATSRSSHSTNANSNYNWGSISQVWMGSSLYNGGTNDLDWITNVPAWMEQQFTMSNFFRGAKLPNTLWFPSDALLRNYYAAIAPLMSLELPGGSWCPQIYTSGGADCTPGTPMVDNYMSERTQAAYASLYFGNDTALGIPVDGNIGLRFVHTGVDANGSVTYPAASGIQNSTSLTPEQLALFNGETLPINGHGSYHNVLPSLNLRFRFTDDLQLRLAASKAMTRPDISALNSYMKIGASWSSAAAGQQASFAGFTASTGGNPALKPMEANQFDAALEWYFGPTSELYATVFKKDIKNYITTEVHAETIDGQPVAVIGPQNAGNGTVKGFEVGYSQFFDFLPGAFKGLGVQANYTFLQSTKIAGTTSCDPNHGNGSCDSDHVVTNPPLPMAGLSPHAYNFTAMYEYGPWSARAAWSWRGKYLIGPVDSGDTYLPMWNAPSGQLDASVFYHLNKNVQIGVQANNLTNTTQKVLMGPTTYTDGFVDWNLYTRALFQNDRRYELVVRATF